MKSSPGLDDFALFLAVADAGGLAGAAETTGVSAPTLSRRLTALERSLGETLFQRGARGYALTARGRALLTEVEPLRTLAQRLRAFGAGETRARVRITAGHWTSHFLACNLVRVWSPDAPWVPELLASNANLDIARRVADIGIRNRRPEQSWLAGRRTAWIDYAQYAAGPQIKGYLTVSEETPTAPADRWLAAHHGDEIVTRASNSRVLLDLARAGLGRVVLPSFIGEDAGGVVRVSQKLDALGHEEWLVAHHEARHDPPVRIALDALATLLTDTALRPPLP